MSKEIAHRTRDVRKSDPDIATSISCAVSHAINSSQDAYRESLGYARAISGQDATYTRVFHNPILHAYFIVGFKQNLVMTLGTHTRINNSSLSLKSFTTAISLDPFVNERLI
jgi:hypothetical protein